MVLFTGENCLIPFQIWIATLCSKVMNHLSQSFLRFHFLFFSDWVKSQYSVFLPSKRKLGWCSKGKNWMNTIIKVNSFRLWVVHKEKCKFFKLSKVFRGREREKRNGRWKQSLHVTLKVIIFFLDSIYKDVIGAILRWQRNRIGRPLSPRQIHQKNIWTLSKFHKTTSECWQRTSSTQKSSPLSSKGDGEVSRLL